MNIEQFEAKVSKVIFRNSKNHYSILLARVNGNTETLIGFFPVMNEGMTIHCFGKKEMGRNKREQFKIESYSIELPKTTYQLYNFLINDFIEMDLMIAGTVIDKVGIDYITKYNDEAFLTEKLGKEYYDLNKNHLLMISKRLLDIQNKLAVMELLVNMGFPNDISAKISFSELNISVVSLKSNPYSLIFPFDLSWNIVDNIALKHGIDFNGDLRIKEGVCYLLDEAVNRLSHIYLPRDELIQRLNKLLKLNITLDEFKIYEKKLESEKKIFCDVELNIYGYRYYQAELQLSKDLYRLNDGKEEDASTVDRLLSILEEDSVVYSLEQSDAIKSCLLSPLTIINGAAGTGKTTVLTKVIQFLNKMKNSGKKITDTDYYHIGLCAPTGKAAERMKEVTGKTARTIHSLLVIHPLFKTPQFNEENSLDFDCLIIDEAGMNDTILFSYILNAAKKNCKVIIVGDESQLPSIGPGNVLKELLNCEDFNRITLSRVYRQGSDSNILDLATCVRKGDSDVYDIIAKRTEDFTFIENHNPYQISDYIFKTMEVLYNNVNVDFYKDVQIITPIHKSKIGTIDLNFRIQQFLNSKSKRKKLTVGDKVFFVDDKVIHTVNNGEKKVFNGETGKVIEIVNKTLMVEFSSGKLVSYSGEELFELDLAFAISVHKMQGSEAPIVIFPIHNIFANMVQRKLIYTGITRAKKKLLLIGEVEAIVRGIENDLTENRNCNLAQRLIESRLSHLFTL